MSEPNKIKEREVASLPISKSFKGILRISNIKDLESTPDTFLNTEYYGEFKPSTNTPVWEPSGIQSAESALKGENIRYVSADEYTTLKIPVTDSMGNYLNFALGVEGSSIGTDYNTGQWKYNGANFYTLSSSSIKVGLEEIKAENTKTIGGGTLYVDNKDNEIAKIVINNYFRHGVSDNNGMFTETGQPIKTIYNASNTSALNDALFYNQESYTINAAGEKECNITIKNLKDYVLNKVESYIKFNTSEVPTASIIYQPCSLDKWYCRIETGIDDAENWQGYRPALGNAIPGSEAAHIDSHYATDNTTQGVYSAESKLEYKESSYVFESVEIPPDFKRGYVLADGSSYEMRLCPPYSADVESADNSKKTLNLFFNLFFTIGYYYTPVYTSALHIYNDADNAPVNKDATLTSKPTYGRYYYDYSDPSRQYYTFEKYNIKEVNREVAYGIAVSSILAFKKFTEAYNNKKIFASEIMDSDGNWDIEKSIDWLSRQNINEEYIFNTIFSDDSITYALEAGIEGINNLKYKYSDADNIHTIVVPVGKEVNKFSDYIEYYENSVDSEGNLLVRNVPCQIFKTAEIYDIARLFAIKSLEWSAYKVRFNVPALYNDNDKTINEFNSSTGNGNTGTVGLFIGSNGTSLADTIRIPSKTESNDFDITYNIQDGYTYQQSSCIFTSGFHPHSHALAKGSLSFTEGRVIAEPQPVSWLSSLTVDAENAKNTLTDINQVKNNIIAADFTWSGDTLKTTSDKPQQWASESGSLNYFLQELGEKQNVKFREVYNEYNGTMGRELAVYNSDGTINNEMHWYGRTSGPVWDPSPMDNSSTQKYTISENIGYFKPQSIKCLPLIKL